MSGVPGRVLFFTSVFVFVIAGLFSGSGCVRGEKEEPRFERFFSWGAPSTEEEMRNALECGVTDVILPASQKKQIELAKKHGLKVYVVFLPAGTHPQQMSPEEERERLRLESGNGLMLPPKATPEQRKEFREKVASYQKSVHYRFGGEPDPENVGKETLIYRIQCFNGPEAMAKMKEKLKVLCANPDLDGIAFDFFGYMNYRGCYCDTCRALYREYLRKHSLADSEKNRDAFYLQCLADCNNELAAYSRSQRKDMKVIDHVYPVFLPDPLYGNRLDLDFCAQTAAWYFHWAPEKIRKYTKVICEQEKAYHSRSAGVPFIGFYDAEKRPPFQYKSPERLELELRAILDAGGRNLMICTPNDFWNRKEYRDVMEKVVRKKAVPDLKKE